MKFQLGDIVQSKTSENIVKVTGKGHLTSQFEGILLKNGPESTYKIDYITNTWNESYFEVIPSIYNEFVTKLDQLENKFS